MFAEAREHLLTVRDWLRYAVSRFNGAHLAFGHGTDNAHDEAAYLILHTLHLPIDRLEPYLDARLTPSEMQHLAHVLDARLHQRLPAPYITREAWLQGHRFYVDERVIIPRSYLAPLILEQFQPWLTHPVERALDLCTGSGCLAVLLALAFPEAQVDAVDLSADALEVARRNVADYGLQGRVRLLESDLYAALSGQRYDLIVANPPYVTEAAMQALPPEYRHEPRLALAGGEDGLAVVRRILAEAPAHLNPNGWLAVEIGHNRAALEAAYPGLPFVWPELDGGEDTVFLIPSQALKPTG
ncbi:MAG: 50S ribosomal protein L3 N(5)-glutamine methyltransferase [Thiobacillaceae bacterium]|nr:50S ribosomal protein L3 N(5)-glutamine methyltransferase [Thiobacillaceae bacterium]